MTLVQLAALCDKYRDRRSIIVDVDEWRQLRQHIGSEAVVAATSTQPPFFWFRDKKIVTPAHYANSMKETSHEP